MIEFIDVNGLAGGLSLGAAQSGMSMIARTGYLGLGKKIVRANKELFDNGKGSWANDIVDSHDANEWPLHSAPVILAVPPCSGFSPITGLGGAKDKTERPHDGHSSNDCMWASARYVARVKPEVYAFESVTGAFKVGRGLMQQLRDEVARLSGETYTLTHLLHDQLSLGGVATRRRYLFVLTKGDQPFKPLAVEELPSATTLSDAIGSLPNVPGTGRKGDIHYLTSVTDWETENRIRRSDNMVDGMWHVDRGQWSDATKGLLAEMEERGQPWPEGFGMDRAMQMLDQIGGPDAVRAAFGRYQRDELAERMIGREYNMGAYNIVRWQEQRYGRVITGGGPRYTVHPTQNRHFHYRELARIMAYPDSFKIDVDEAKGEKLDAIWGKNVSPIVGRWLGRSIRQHLGDLHWGPELTPTPIGDGEYLLDELDDSRRLVRAAKAATKTAA